MVGNGGSGGVRFIDRLWPVGTAIACRKDGKPIDPVSGMSDKRQRKGFPARVAVAMV
jgi:hypothetical protein